jgi:hypothetical protein
MPIATHQLELHAGHATATVETPPDVFLVIRGKTDRPLIIEQAPQCDHLGNKVHMAGDR